jgi:2-C-methyl-D-erythritol 4-phosphate cytidylyltransferase
VVLAGGVGARLGDPLPKQLLPLGGRPVIEHTIAAFDRHPDVDELLVLMVPGHLATVRDLVERGGYRKVRDVLEGGTTRMATTGRALAALTGRSDSSERSAEIAEDRKVLLHDAVRPLVSARIIADCFAALDTAHAVTVAIPSSDTVVEVDGHDTITAVPSRAALRRVQTPQGFWLSLIFDAHARAAQDAGTSGFEATDDCSVVLRYRPEVPVRVVAGEERNLKITHRTDLLVAEALRGELGDAALP